MKIGDKVIITEDGMSKESIDIEAISGVHPVTVDFKRKSYMFSKGDKGIITDLNASGDRWKINVNGVIKYVPCEYVSLKTRNENK